MGIISKHCRKLVMEILFQLLLKGCTIEAISENRFGKSTELFQLLLISLKYANGLRNGAKGVSQILCLP